VRRALFIIDGEHYMPVICQAIDAIEERENLEAVAAVFLGSAEKIGGAEAVASLDLPVLREKEALQMVCEAIERFNPEVVVDLSDAPAMDERLRMEVAAECLARGLTYIGADFRFSVEPPIMVRRPALSVFSLTKRAGKTALCTYIATLLKEVGETPIIFTMSRGGPPEPTVVKAGTELTPNALVAIADKGLHAAADHYENALFSGVTAIGSRRAGGGFSGRPFFTNLHAAIKLASKMKATWYLFEGSGTDAPPVEPSGKIVLISASTEPAALLTPFNRVRVRVADIAVLVHAEPPHTTAAHLQELKKCLQSINPKVVVCACVLRPFLPQPPKEGSRVAVTTTMPEAVHDRLRSELQNRYGLNVMGVSSALANRSLLSTDVRRFIKQGIDAFVTELKSASVEVVIRSAISRKIPVHFLQNRPVSLPEWEPSLRSALQQLVKRVKEPKRR